MAAAHARKRGNDGMRTHTERALPVRLSLAYAVCPPQPLERKAPAAYNGPKKAGNGPRGRLSDAQFLQIRALHKFGCMKKARIAGALGLTLGEVVSALTYRTRSHLDPRPEHAVCPAPEAAAVAGG